MNLLRAASLLSLLAVLVPSGLLAGHEHERGGGPRVILYEHPDFRGGSIVLRPGEAVENLSRWDFDNGRRANDRISSIRVEGGAEVTVFTDARFRGAPLKVTRDIRDLRRVDGNHGPRFDDNISSVRVEMVRRPPPPPPAPPHRPVDVDRLIERAYLDIVGRAPTGDQLLHYRRLMLNEGWSEHRVREDLRYSDEVVHAYIVKLYREIFGRDPRHDELGHYRRGIQHNRWSDVEVRNDMQRRAAQEGRVPSRVDHGGGGHVGLLR